MLRSAVAARFGYDPFFAWARQTVVVEVRRERDRYTSRVQVVDQGGVARGARDLASTSASCSELFDATALAISIALDAEDRADPPPPSPSPPAPSSASTAAPPTPPPPTAPVLAPPSVVPDQTPAPTSFPPDRRTSLGLALVGSDGSAPSVSAGFIASGELRVRALSVALEGRVDAPTGTTDTAGARVSSWLYAGSLVPCLHLGPAFLCGVGSLGQFIASGSGVRFPSSGSWLYTAAGGRVGGEWPLSPSWSLRAHVDGLFDVDRPSYRLDGATAWGAPLLMASLAFGVAVRIP